MTVFIIPGNISCLLISSSISRPGSQGGGAASVHPRTDRQTGAHCTFNFKLFWTWTRKDEAKMQKKRASAAALLTDRFQTTPTWK